MSWVFETSTGHTTVGLGRHGTGWWDARTELIIDDCRVVIYENLDYEEMVWFWNGGLRCG